MNQGRGHGGARCRSFLGEVRPKDKTDADRVPDTVIPTDSQGGLLVGPDRAVTRVERCKGKPDLPRARWQKAATSAQKRKRYAEGS
jgi:hypothetical protein